MKNIYALEGKNRYDLDSFFNEFAKAVNAPNGYFGRDLMQFDDCLFGGFGLEAPCEIIWKESNLSKEKLDCNMLREYYEIERINCEKGLVNELKELHEGGRKDAKEDECFFYDMLNISKYMIEKAENGEMTMFDEIVETIKSVTNRARLGWIVDLKLE
ncbi:barstar family protein [Clostridium beijerinckii]|uniref:barstar family protein n=1 Tax=Clostridium beijerinckii TaxID=1520 RepID=UPI001493EEC4|nr:barstar family protein [Clostridium beijerinckii]NOW05194.1 RNAse (barnase) inhibitor barstar [Clostridium beijerinckii]NYC01664.1 RNAse (barnase) inhibitor barstar [Clostridium beijerinckii]